MGAIGARACVSTLPIEKPLSPMHAEIHLRVFGSKGITRKTDEEFRHEGHWRA
jgi:hypothetical protein